MGNIIIHKILKYLKDSDYRFIVNAGRFNHYPRMEDELYVRRMFKAKLGYDLNLENPKTFNEKMQWLKLYDKNPSYSQMVDKYEVKKYVAGIIGEEHIIPTIGIWDRVDEIDFNTLPNQFVLKCTHDSHGLIICKDKGNLNIKEETRKLEIAYNTNYFYIFREWPYKNVKPRIIAEQYMKDESTYEMRDYKVEKDCGQYGICEGLSDYKVHCFNGTPEVILVCRNRFAASGMTEDFFDAEWNHLNVRREKHGNSEQNIPRPNELDEMLTLAGILSNDIPFLRVDFYIINHRVYLGELTFYPASGFERFIPESFDYEMGKKIKLDMSGR